MALTTEQLEAISKEFAVVELFVRIYGGSSNLDIHTGQNGRSIEVSISGKGRVATMASLKIDNRDDFIADFISSEGSLSGLLAQVKCKIISPVDGSVEMPSLSFGKIESPKIGEDLVFSIKYDSVSSHIPKITGTRQCGYAVNGDQCGLTGAFCNRTYVNCVSNSNAARFGGFRWALPEGTTIYVDGGPIPISSFGSSNSGGSGGLKPDVWQWWMGFIDIERLEHEDGEPWQI
jgi:hypothetical protein